MNKCLSRVELYNLISQECDGILCPDTDLACLIEDARNWQCRLSGVSYMLSKIVERGINDDEDYTRFISSFYYMPDTMWFDIQELEEKFICFLLNQSRNTSLTIEEEIIDLQNRIGDYSIGPTIRY
jgi:hypothetical protein